MLVVVEKHIIDMVFYKTSFSEFQELFLGAILKTIMNWISSMFQDDATYLIWAFGLILLASQWCRCYHFTILQM